MKRFPMAALIAANIFLLLLACTNEKVIGPVKAALPESILGFISPEEGNTLTADENELLYVPAPDASDFLSADSANALRAGSDGLLFTSASSGGSGERGPEGPAGPEGPKGAEGPQGPPGTSVKIVGSVGQANQLPNNAEAGDGWLVQGDLWVWSGDGWNNVGRIQGPPGERGPEGSQGQRGPGGATGPKGDQGDRGEPGPKGDRGEQGREGPQGPMGPPGTGGGGLSVISGGAGLTPEMLIRGGTDFDFDDPDQRIAGGLVMLQCHMEDESDFFFPVPCWAYMWEGKLRVSVDLRDPPHDTGGIGVTLIGTF